MQRQCDMSGWADALEDGSPAVSDRSRNSRNADSPNSSETSAPSSRPTPWQQLTSPIRNQLVSPFRARGDSKPPAAASRASRGADDSEQASAQLSWLRKMEGSGDDSADMMRTPKKPSAAFRQPAQPGELAERSNQVGALVGTSEAAAAIVMKRTARGHGLSRWQKRGLWMDVDSKALVYVRPRRSRLAPWWPAPWWPDRRTAAR